MEMKQRQQAQRQATRPNLNPPRALAWAWLIAGFLGFLDAAYLSIEHFRNATPHCFLIQGCDIVTTSRYSAFWGIPVALLGALYYCAIIILSYAYLDSESPRIHKIIIPFSFAGFFASLYFVYLQFFVIRAWCIYCIGSALSSTALFVVSLIALTLRHRLASDLSSAPKKA